MNGQIQIKLMYLLAQSMCYFCLVSRNLFIYSFILCSFIFRGVGPGGRCIETVVKGVNLLAQYDDRQTPHRKTIWRGRTWMSGGTWVQNNTRQLSNSLTVKMQSNNKMLHVFLHVFPILIIHSFWLVTKISFFPPSWIIMINQNWKM